MTPIPVQAYRPTAHSHGPGTPLRRAGSQAADHNDFLWPHPPSPTKVSLGLESPRETQSFDRENSLLQFLPEVSLMPEELSRHLQHCMVCPEHNLATAERAKLAAASWLERSYPQLRSSSSPGRSQKGKQQ